MGADSYIVFQRKPDHRTIEVEKLFVPLLWETPGLFYLKDDNTQIDTGGKCQGNNVTPVHLSVNSVCVEMEGAGSDVRRPFNKSLYGAQKNGFKRSSSCEVHVGFD